MNAPTRGLNHFVTRKRPSGRAEARPEGLTQSDGPTGYLSPPLPLSPSPPAPMDS